ASRRSSVRELSADLREAASLAASTSIPLDACRSLGARHPCSRWISGVSPPQPSCGPERACRPPGCSPWPSRSPPKTHCFEPPAAGGAVTLAAARKVGSTGDVPAALTACAAADHLRARRIVVSRADRFLAEERSGCPTPSGVTLAHADLLPALFGRDARSV